MSNQFGGSALNQKTIAGHPVGLFVLFFTEMWERFSYYGMRAILVLFLTSSILNEGWAWEREDALELYAWYTGLVYLTPIFGGLIADKFLGYRNATVLGALIMTLGHASMALETFSSTFFFIGLSCLVIGNGFFKPNISSIVGQLYKDGDIRKDGGYTIFYMGINAGAFLGILLCGYVGEKVGWHLGFGLAGVFKKYFSSREILIAREITKIHETFYRDNVDSFQLFNSPLKGELTVVISKKNNKTKTLANDSKIKGQAIKLLKKNSLKDVVKIISEKEKVNKRLVYKICLDIKNEKIS